jgi:hypothetical protein
MISHFQFSLSFFLKKNTQQLSNSTRILKNHSNRFVIFLRQERFNEVRRVHFDEIEQTPSSSIFLHHDKFNSLD